MAGSLYRSRKYLTSPTMLYIKKSQMKPKMKYCRHIWTETAQSPFSSLDTIQKSLCDPVGDELFSTLHTHRRKSLNTLSLFP